MKVYVLTFGTSDLQIKLNSENPKFFFEQGEKFFTYQDNHQEIKIEVKKNRNSDNYYLLNSPREGGKTILDNYHIFKEVIHFPLLWDNFLLHQHLNENCELVLVSTDQTDENFKRNDSLYYAEFFKVFVKDKTGITKNIFHEFRVTDNLVSIDYQYNYFRNAIKEKRLIRYDDSEIEKVILLPQGGIDQINHALTLQLVRHFHHKLEIYQVKEGKNESKSEQIKFANIFYTDLILDKVSLLVQRGDYNGAYALLKNNETDYQDLKAWIEFAKMRISHLYEKMCNNFGRKKFKDEKLPDFIRRLKEKEHSANQELINLLGEQSFKEDIFDICEKFEKTRLLLDNKANEDFIVALHVAIETLLNYAINYITKFDLTNKDNNYQENERKFLENVNANEKIKKIYKESFGGNEEEISIASIPALLSTILEKYPENDLVKNLCQFIRRYQYCKCDISGMRNDIVHRGKGIEDVKIDKIKEVYEEVMTYILREDSLSYSEMNKLIIDCIETCRNNLTFQKLEEGISS